MILLFLLVTSSGEQYQPRGRRWEPAFSRHGGVKKISDILFGKKIIQVEFWEFGVDDTAFDDCNPAISESPETMVIPPLSPHSEASSEVHLGFSVLGMLMIFWLGR